MSPPAPLRHAPVAATILSLGLLSAVLAAPTAVSIPFAPHGDGSRGSISAPVPLTPQTYLCGAEGADGALGTADDVVLLVASQGGTPSVTALPTPGLTDFTGAIVRLSATRALAISEGVDGSFGTADDAVLLLDHLGSGNTVTPIVVGGLQARDGYTPERLSASSAVVSTRGADLLANTLDDTVVLLSDLGDSNTVTPLAAPHLENNRARPRALSPTTFLVPANGPDANDRTADDQVYLFTGVGSTNARTDLDLPFQYTLAPRQPVRVTATRALMTVAGPDGSETTADDRLVLLDQLGTTNTLTFIPVPNIQDFGSGVAVPLTETTAVVVTEGPDSTQQTSDDAVAVLTGLGTSNTVTLVTIGGLDEDRAAQPVPLSNSRVVFSSAGPNNSLNNADDEVVVISNVGTSNTVTRIPVPGLAFGATSMAQPLSQTAVVLSNGGPNGVLDSGLDDEISLIQGVGGTVTRQTISADGEFGGAATSAIPQLLGLGRAVAVSSGPNGDVGSGNDDVMRLVSGLPQVRFVDVRKLQVVFKPSTPLGPETFQVTGIYHTDDAGLLLGEDVTVSVGNAAVTIPASAFRLKKSALVYKNRQPANGFITDLVIDPIKGKFQLKGRGVTTGIRSTNPGYVPFAVEAGSVYLSDVVAARQFARGLRFP